MSLHFQPDAYLLSSSHPSPFELVDRNSAAQLSGARTTAPVLLGPRRSKAVRATRLHNGVPRSAAQRKYTPESNASCSPPSRFTPSHTPHIYPQRTSCRAILDRAIFGFLARFLLQTMSSAGPSRPHVVTLTADQLLGTSLTPTRPHNKHKNSSAPRVLTIEDLLGSGLTVARQPSRPAAPRSSPRPTSSRASGSSSNRTAPNPRLVRVTADEVLRTGIPVRTLQAVKARSQVLSAEELLATPSSRSSTQRPVQTRGRATVAHSGPGSSSGSGSGFTGTGASAGRSTGGSSATDSHGTRSAAPHASRNNETSGHFQSRNPRATRRSMSLGSMRTLPIYTQEPGDSEVVIDR